MKYEFKHVNGRIILVATTQIWGGDVVKEIDVTDQVMPSVDDYLDHRLGLTDYRYKNAKLSYEGEDKDKYQK